MNIHTHSHTRIRVCRGPTHRTQSLRVNRLGALTLVRLRGTTRNPATRFTRSTTQLASSWAFTRLSFADHVESVLQLQQARPSSCGVPCSWRWQGECVPPLWELGTPHRGLSCPPPECWASSVQCTTGPCRLPQVQYAWSQVIRVSSACRQKLCDSHHLQELR